MKPEQSTATFSSDETRWNAVSGHDSSADGAFFYAVRTTGVFCRPSCASRQPRRENVEFFDTPQQAESAGYRACKRCQPGSLSRELAIVERACKVLDAHAQVRAGGHCAVQVRDDVVGVSVEQRTERRVAHGPTSESGRRSLTAG